MAEHQPGFDLISIAPAFVIGPDYLATKADDLKNGTNQFVTRMVCGNKPGHPMPSGTVHIDDVAFAHVRAVDSSVPGDKLYITCAKPPDGIVWNDAIGVVKESYPERVADGTLSNDGETATLITKFDSSETERVFGFKHKPFREMVRDVIGQYLDLLG